MAKRERGNLLGALLGVLLLPALIVLGPAAAAQPTPPECFGQPATIVGTGAGETLNGTAGDDVIVGLGGADKIEGRGGDDRICGGAGSDTINGGGGNDLISGETGSDKISGGGGGDRIFGGPDDDTLSGDTGNDFLFGEGGADSMDGGDGQDNCFVESRSDDASGCESNLPPNQAPTDITLSNSSLAENQPSGSTVGTLAAVDPDIGDSHTFALVPGAGDADNGRFAISGSSLNTAAVLDFESQATYSVLVRATDIGGLFVEKAFTITVTDTNEPPLVDTVSGGLSYTENDPATVVAGVITVTDPDSANLTGATVQITGNYAAGQDVLAMAAQPNITAAFDAGTGTLTLSGTDTVAAYEAALESVTYHNTSDDPATPNRSVAFAARDAAGFGPPDVREIAIVAVDDPPAAVSDNASASEDSTSNAIDVLANDTDPDGGPKSVSAVSQPANGSVAITNNGAGVHYTPNPNYCNSPPGTSPDSFTYTLNGVSQATVSVLVSCDDDPPVGVNDSASVAEDSSANAIDVLANDTDVDGGPKSVASVTQPPNGSVTITGGGAGVSYTPNADYCNASTTDDSFTYTLNGGSTASVFVTVNCADDAPAAINDSATVAEDSSSNAIDVLANDTDVDGGTKTIESVTQPANGSVAITGGGTGLSYTPNADYCNAPPGTAPDTFNYTINGGLAATVSVTVNCSGDAPVVDNSAGTTTFTENSAAVAVDGSVTVADADAGAAISEATVEITGNYAAGEDVLALGGSHPGISASVAGNKLTLTGPASPAAFQAALRDVTYVNTAETPSELLRTLTFTVTDDTNLSGSDTKSLSVAGADDPPAGVNDSVTVAEDSSSNAIDVLANDTDADGGPKSVDSVTQPANGSVAVTGGGTGVSYTPNAQYCNSPPGDALDIFTYTLNGGSTATVSVTVTCSPDAPVVDTSAGTTTYTENAAPSGIDPNVTVVDADAGATITGATVRITSNFAPGQDILALAGTHGPGITATFSGDTLTLSGTASISAYQAALQEVTYANSSEGPSTLIRTVTFTVTDNTALTGSDTKSLEVTPVNDPPTAVDDAGTTDEDTILPVAAPGVLANDTDIDPGDTKTVVALNSSGTLSGSTAKGGSVTINANGSYSYTPPAAFQALSTGQSDTDSFTYTMADGGGAESTATVNLTVTGISDAPTAVADTFDAIGNTGLFAGRSAPGGEAAKVVTGSVLDNDTDPDSPHTSLVAEPVVNAATALGGMITIEPDGNFTYHPDDGDVGVTDTFTYRVCDASPCNSATVANSTGTLSLPLAGQVWYVKNNQPDGGDGTSDTPFDTLAEAELASGAGDTVYVFDGDNTSADLDTGYVMATDERLIGESRPLAKDPDGGGPLPLSLLYTGIPGAQPTLTASNEDVVALASNSIVDGIDVDPSGTGGGFSAGAGVTGVGVFRSNVIDSGTAGTQPGIELDGTTGSSGFSQVTVTNGGSSGAIGIRLNNAGTVSFPTGNSITTTGAKALDIASTSMGNSVFNSITVTDSSSGGVRMSATTGNPITFGDGAGTDLSLTTTSGTAPALELKNTGRVLIPSAGNSSISATGGPAVDIVNPGASSSFELDSVSSTNSAGDGINLDGAGVNLFSAPSGSISGAAAIAVDVNDGGAISYGGALNDGAGSTAEITGRSSGHTLALSGNIADSSDAGGGIALSGNSSGAVIFSGSSKVINTGAGDAVVATGNPGHALELSGGGLDIDTTGGRGLEASGGGSISVQGTGNTITTTTGTPLNITNVTITPNVTFQSISANGATQGIVLSGVGSAGSMSVTGTGPSGSGGTIQNIANRGASFINARNITLSDMNFTNANQNDGATPDGLPGSNGDENGAVHLDAAVNVALTDIAITTTAQHGINGVGVRNLDLTNVTINDAGNETPAANGNLESGVYLTNLTGLASASQDNVFSNLNVSNTGSFNVYVANGTPTSAGGEKDKLTMTGGTFNTAGQNVLSDNVTVDNFNSANFQTVVTNSSFTAGTTCGGGTSTCSPDNIQVNGNNTSKFDVSISGSTFTQAGQSAINVSGSGSAVGSFSIANNPNLTVRAAQGINIASNGSSDLSGTIAGNTISTNVNNNPGVGIDMVVDAAGGSIVANVSNNTIAGSGANIFEYGIRGGARNGNGTADITLNNNTVQAADGAGVWIFAGNNTGQGSDTCVNFVSNQIDGNGANAFTDYFLDNYAGSTFSVQGFASGTIQDYVASTDDDPSPNDPTVTINSSSSPFTNATCATP